MRIYCVYCGEIEDAGHGHVFPPGPQPKPRFVSCCGVRISGLETGAVRHLDNCPTRRKVDTSQVRCECHRCEEHRELIAKGCVIDHSGLIKPPLRPWWMEDGEHA